MGFNNKVVDVFKPYSKVIRETLDGTKNGQMYEILSNCQQKLNNVIDSFGPFRDRELTYLEDLAFVSQFVEAEQLILHGMDKKDVYENLFPGCNYEGIRSSGIREAKKLLRMKSKQYSSLKPKQEIDPRDYWFPQSS